MRICVKELIETIYNDDINFRSSSSSRTTTLLPPKGNVVTENTESKDAGLQASITSSKEHYLQIGYRINGAFVDTGSISLNGSIAENVWHRMSLIVDKDSTYNIQLFFDGTLLGRFSENLPPRDVGGVFILNNERSFSEEEGFKGNRALFKNFVVGRCLRFDSHGECKYDSILKPFKFFALYDCLSYYLFSALYL